MCDSLNPWIFPVCSAGITLDISSITFVNHSPFVIQTFTIFRSTTNPCPSGVEKCIKPCGATCTVGCIPGATICNVIIQIGCAVIFQGPLMDPISSSMVLTVQPDCSVVVTPGLPC